VTVPRPVMLLILDGFGWREAQADNAVALADTPNFDRLWQAGPHAFLRTSGGDVGLPKGQMGNSEVGHLNIGAGRVVHQELARIGDAIKDGSIATMPALVKLIAAAKRTGGTCHLIGLVSDGGVHAHQDHAIALAKILDAAGIPVALHAFTDGRDTPPQSGAGFLKTVVAALPPSATIATVSGRYYAMDRDNRWPRVARAWRAMALAEADRFATAAEAIAAGYAQNVTDEFLAPAIIGPYQGMRDGDVLLSFNFRSDRIRELLAALIDDQFDGFPRPDRIAFAAVAGMTHYSDTLSDQMDSLFAPSTLINILGEVVSKAGLKQLRMAETEKYPHVTYFFNGGEETPYPGEDRIMVPSPKVATYDLQPEMSAEALTDKAVEAIGSGTYDLVIMNYANPDMVGHTGSLPAAIKAVEAVDTGLGRIEAAIVKAGGALLVTADHGNCELMRDPETGGPHTAHTTNPVPIFLAGQPGARLRDGRLADLAPTLMALLTLPQPVEMTGRSLIAK
jgi:2,3-bisphosphoglycerate-independent phosphoglycerate mutase